MIKNIIFLGSGNLASHLGKIFHSKKYKILQIYSRNAKTGNELAKSFNSEYISNIEKLSTEADLYILSMTDNANLMFTNELRFKSSKIFVHTSGSLSMEILKNLTDNYGVFYPFQTFRKDIEIFNYEKIPFCIEASNDYVLDELTEICKNINCKYYNINSVQREKLHIAGVFASNFMNHCIYLGEKILNENNIDNEILKPLLEQSFHKVLNYGAYCSQTGPAIRKDKEIIKKHIEILGENTLETKIYKILSESIHNTYHKK